MGKKNFLRAENTPQQKLILEKNDYLAFYERLAKKKALNVSHG